MNVIHPEKDVDAPVCVLLLAHSRSLVSFGWTSNLDLYTPGLMSFPCWYDPSFDFFEG